MTTRNHESGKTTATILFSVFPGLNEISDQLDPDIFTDLMNQLFKVTDSVISLYGGRVDKFSGDGLMAIFGISGDNEKAPYNAVNVASDLQFRITELNREMDLPAPVSIKTGIQTGHVLLGKFGSEEKAHDTVMGDTVTLASRICDIADPGQVLTGKETYEKTKDRFEFQVLEPVPLKGLKAPLPVFEVKGRKKAAVAAKEHASRMIASTMVGRENEFRLLEKMVMQLINGQGGVVTVEGQAGIGKSRLMHELKESEVIKKVVLLEGRGVSNGKNLSFHPIIQIIKSWAGIFEEDSPEESANKLQKAVRRVYADAFYEIYPFMATMMGYRLEGREKERIRDIEGEALEKLILKNIRDLLSKAASNRPVLIVIEDAHWCDASSIIFLESLVKLVYKQRILFVILFRPGYRESGERIKKFLSGNLQDHYTGIGLVPLTQIQSETLIQNLLNQVNLPQMINQLVIERSAGNPFFIEEIVRYFIDAGLIGIRDQGFVLAEDINYANIPETIDNVIISRLERLDEKTRELLKTASIIGRNFYYKVLEEAAQTIEEIDNKLEYLKDIQLIHERKQKDKDEVEFLFKHALAQQATYESIVEKTKKDLHLKIARSIEKVFATRIHEFYGILAHHYGKAGQKDKTGEYLIKAGEESLKSGASSEAVSFFKQALELIDPNTEQDRQKIIDLEEKLAFGLNATGQYMETIKYCDRLIAYYYKPLPESDFRRFIDLFVNIALTYRVIYLFKYDPEARGQDINQRLLKINLINSQSLAFVDPRSLFFISFYSIRFIKNKQFGHSEAIYVMSYSIVTFYTGLLLNMGKKLISWGRKFVDERFIREWVWGQSLIVVHDYFTGKLTAIEDEEKIIRYANRSGDYFYAVQFYFYSCLGLIEKGDEKLTLHYLKRILQVSEAFDSNSSLAQYHRINMTYNLKFRKWDDFLQITDEVLGFIKKYNQTYVLISVYSFRTIAYTFQADFSEAGKNLSEAEKIVKSLKILALINIFYIAKTYLEIAEFNQKNGKEKDAGNLLKTSKKLIRLAHKARKNLTEAYRLRAIIFSLIHKPEKALRNFEKSIEAGISYDCNLELSRTYFEAGKFLQDPKNKKTRVNGLNATECLMSAKAMFEEMGLEWDLQEYRKYTRE